MRIEKIYILSNGTPKEEYNIPNVIRCKDCKYWVKDFSSIEEHEIFSYLKETCIRSGICKEIPMSADDFCSRGEKRNE